MNQNHHYWHICKLWIKSILIFFSNFILQSFNDILIIFFIYGLEEYQYWCEQISLHRSLFKTMILFRWVLLFTKFINRPSRLVLHYVLLLLTFFSFTNVLPIVQVIYFIFLVQYQASITVILVLYLFFFFFDSTLSCVFMYWPKIILDNFL